MLCRASLRHRDSRSASELAESGSSTRLGTRCQACWLHRGALLLHSPAWRPWRLPPGIFTRGPMGGCQGDGNTVPSHSPGDLFQGRPGSPGAGGVLCPVGTWRPRLLRSPSSLSACIWGYRRVCGTHGDCSFVLPVWGFRAQACVTLPATQHVTRVPEAKHGSGFQGRGRGLRGTAGSW